MAEKEIKKVPPRVENIIKGLFVVLFSIILIINVGKVGRTLAFPLVYLFGASYYFIVAFFLFLGLYRIFKQKKLKIFSKKINSPKKNQKIQYEKQEIMKIHHIIILHLQEN